MTAFKILGDLSTNLLCVFLMPPRPVMVRLTDPLQALPALLSTVLRSFSAFPPSLGRLLVLAQNSALLPQQQN